jgi:ATP-binding cassette subfamily F protein 2
MGRKDNKKKTTTATSTAPSQKGEVASTLKSLGFEGEVDRAKISVRTATGQLTSQYLSRDLKIESFSISLHGHELVSDTKLELNWGRRYGLIGVNGSGKSTLLKCLGEREVPIPKWMNIFHLEHEAAPTDQTALEAVIHDIDQEIKRIEAEIDETVATEGTDSEKLNFLYECLDLLDSETVTKRAGEILHGLGFNKAMQQKKTKDFSGGWRMRISLARALFIRPMILLLDEPTNHLDLEACVWLEEHLKKYDRILMLISHSQDFLNGVTTNTIHLHSKKLTYYGGNYDTYIQTRFEQEENQMKQFVREQDEIKHMKEYIARFGHGSAKLARQAQSKEKTLARMQEKGLTEEVVREKYFEFEFIECGKLPPPVLTFNHVSFSYSGNDKEDIYRDIDFGIDLDSRVALVGPNGAGKSTLVKLMVGDCLATKGMVRRHHKLRIGWYHQHLTEHLDLQLSALEFMMKEFPDEKEPEQIRRMIGRYGLTGKAQTMAMETLSDGLKSRVMIAWIAYQNPHLLLLDEPTNHLDIETIDALADAINKFDGGLVLVSHDFRLINQVAKEIWVCEHRKVQKWDGDILSYKTELRKRINMD